MQVIRVHPNHAPGVTQFMLCRLNTACKGQKGKWPTVCYIEVIQDGATVEDVKTALLKQGRATVREFQRQQVRIFDAVAA